MSFTLAAEELSISQSAVSHQVKSLEAYFGVPLFYRTKGLIRLTAEGERLCTACEAAFSHLSQIGDYLPESELRGTITLSSPPLIFNWWLLPRLKAFTQQYPNIRFRFLQMTCGARVLPTDMDIALLWDTKIADGFVGAPMLNMVYCPVASPRLAATLPEIFDAEVLVRTILLHENDHTGWKSWMSEAGYPDIGSTSGWVFQDPGMMIEAAASGQGIALGPFPLLEELVSSGRLVRLFGHSIKPHHTYFLTMSIRNLEKPPLRLFWNWFAQDGLPSFSKVTEHKVSN
jgi:LysR family glycine cleavage system transcriptional activator